MDFENQQTTETTTPDYSEQFERIFNNEPSVEKTVGDVVENTDETQINEEVVETTNLSDEDSFDEVETKAEGDQALETTEPSAEVQNEGRKIKVQGQEIIIPPDKEEEYLSKGVDYTLKTQKLAEREREIEQKAIRLEKWEQFDQQLSRDPKLNDFLNYAMEQYYQSNGNIDIPKTDLFDNPVVQEMKQQLELFKEMQYEQLIQKEWTNLYAKYPEAKKYEADIYNLSAEYNIPFEASFEILRGRNLTNQVQTEKQKMVQNNMKKQVMTKTVKPSAPVHTDTPQKPKTFEEGKKLFAQKFNNLF